MYKLQCFLPRPNFIFRKFEIAACLQRTRSENGNLKQWPNMQTLFAKRFRYVSRQTFPVWLSHLLQTHTICLLNNVLQYGLTLALVSDFQQAMIARLAKLGSRSVEDSPTDGVTGTLIIIPCVQWYMDQSSQSNSLHCTGSWDKI